MRLSSIVSPLRICTRGMSTSAGVALPKSMRAVTMSEPGDARVLETSSVPLPKLHPNEVMVKVAAAGVNRPDLLQRAGLYPAPKGSSPYLGLEVSGRIVAIGSEAEKLNSTLGSAGGLKVGTKVMALTNGGGYAEYVSIPVGQVLPVPRGVPLNAVEAATFPEALFTVYHNLFHRGGLSRDDTVLIHGGASGIGTMAIQMAKAAGASVAVTAGNEDKCDACRRLGADLVINYKQEDFVDAVKAWSPTGINVAMSMVGGDYISRTLRLLDYDGRLVFIAFQGGAVVTLDMSRIMLKRLVVTGSTLRSQSSAAKAELASQVFNEVWPLMESGDIIPVVHAVFPMDGAAEAHELLEEGQHVGKICLAVDPTVFT